MTAKTNTYQSRKCGIIIPVFNCLALLALCFAFSNTHAQTRTTVSIKGKDFYINNEITLKGITLNGLPLEGLLPNSRMVQGIFDDLNPETRKLWKYPDTGIWDPDRNTDEFVAAIPEWRKHGLLAFTLNIQGGSPTGYGNKGWINPGFEKDGQPIMEYFSRLGRILKKADESGMVVILGIFYFGQDEHLRDEAAVKNAVTKTVDWLFAKGYRNVLIEINNECNSKSYDHSILRPDRIHELIELVKNRKDPKSGYRFYVSTSYGGRHIPHPNVVQSADFILLHGNGAEDPAQITQMVEETRKVEGYHTMPVVFNEDDHYNFDKPVNNMIAALKAGASWGFFDFRKRGETLAPGDSTFKEGYQSIPVDWGIHSQRKKEFFSCLAALSGLKSVPESDPRQEMSKFRGARLVTARNYPNCIELSNDSVRVVLEPNLGGRVLAYELGGKNVLYVDDTQDGLIYEGKSLHPSGGRCDFGPEKTVPAHPLLFLGKWSARMTGDREAEMISQKDAASGVQLIRKFKLAKSGSRLEFTQVIKNISNSTKSYCHWSRTFVKGSGISLAPLNPQSRYPKKYMVYGPGNIMNFMPESEDNIRIRDGLLEIVSPPSQPKIITDTDTGWLAYITTDNQLFIKKYPVYPLRIYGEMAACTACVYYKPLYCEIEPIGPMETISPGKEAAFTEYWYLFDYQYPADKKVNLKELLTKIHELRPVNSEQ